MSKISKVRLLISYLLVIAMVFSVVPEIARAQGAQHNESDLDFTRRMIKRTDAVLAETRKLEKVIVRGWNDEKKRSSVEQKKPMPQTKEHILLARQAGTTSATDPDRYGKVKVKFNWLQEQAQAERKRLQAHEATHTVQSRGSNRQRQSTEAKVRQLERDLAALKKETATLEAEDRMVRKKPGRTK